MHNTGCTIKRYNNMKVPATINVAQYTWLALKENTFNDSHILLTHKYFCTAYNYSYDNSKHFQHQSCSQPLQAIDSIHKLYEKKRIQETILRTKQVLECPVVLISRYSKGIVQHSFSPVQWPQVYHTTS